MSILAKLHKAQASVTVKPKNKVKARVVSNNPFSSVFRKALGDAQVQTIMSAVHELQKVNGGYPKDNSGGTPGQQQPTGVDRMGALSGPDSTKLALRLYQDYVSDEDMSTLPYFIMDLDALIMKHRAGKVVTQEEPEDEEADDILEGEEGDGDEMEEGEEGEEVEGEEEDEDSEAEGDEEADGEEGDEDAEESEDGEEEEESDPDFEPVEVETEENKDEKNTEVSSVIDYTNYPTTISAGLVPTVCSPFVSVSGSTLKIQSSFLPFMKNAMLFNSAGEVVSINATAFPHSVTQIGTADLSNTKTFETGK